MLIIYSALRMGGIETFFVRLARERYRQGLHTKVLLLANDNESDPELLAQMEDVADIYRFNDLFHQFPILKHRFKLFSPMKNNNVLRVLEGVTQVHVSNAENALLADRLINIANACIPITVGVYHSLEFSWGGKSLPHFENINRKFVLQHLPDANLMCFAESTKEFMQRKHSLPIKNAKVFRLGVVSGSTPTLLNDGASSSKVGYREQLKICTVGRLVEFKSYNLWMLDVVKELVDMGLPVVFDIYGEGPLSDEVYSKIQKLGIDNAVKMMGTFEYSKFNDVVREYDLFVGSGTAIIQASFCGVPSIIGIESIPEPVSYGFFSDFSEYEYHHPTLNFPKKSVVDIIANYYQLDVAHKHAIAKHHIKAAEMFSMAEVVRNFELPYLVSSKRFRYSKVSYYFSEKLFDIKHKLSGIRVDYTKTKFTDDT
ncbi:glycosyltransferase [Franzmannia qiaohouensis]|uniref:Glycosyltransferase n=1 Tax=Franzmannia qiaohouensis TaxID=1329370 RepID=A0ABU1HJ35_9GAMM|nr:glycosyltransferase [Halomonas qiaohouensis]MDR5907490.1 hypothetical protein [Halomonas qiaohouensis]